MPHTTKEMAELADISESSIRNYTHTYKALLSPAARGEAGNRLFTDEDVRVLCAVAALRRAHVPPAEIIERLQQGDVYIEPQQAPAQAPSPQEALQAPQMALQVPSSIAARFEAIERRQDVLLRAAVLWGALLGAIAALVAGGFVLWVLWLLI